MKRTIRFAWLLFAALLLLAALVPFAAFADETYEITVAVTDDQGVAADYGAVTLKANGEEISPTDGKYTVPAGSDIEITAEPNEGYEVIEWVYSDKSGEIIGVFPELSATSIPTIGSNYVVCVKLQPCTYEINYVGQKKEEIFGFDYNGPTGYAFSSTSAKNRTYGVDQEIPNASMIVGYTFLRWDAYQSPDDTEPSNVWKAENTIDGSVSFNLYLVPVWQANDYTVTLDAAVDAQDLIERGSEETVATYDAPLPDVVPPARSGYTFLGYFLDETLYYNADGTAAVAKWAYAENKTLTAKWQANDYTVSLDPAVGEKPLVARGDESTVATYDAPLSQITPPARSGYTFLGYFLGETLYYSADGTPAVATWVHAENKTLTAKWQANNYIVALDAAVGDRPLVERGSEETVVTYDAPLSDIVSPERSGYSFLGYFLGDVLYYDSDGTAVVSAWGYAEAKTLTAKWEANAYLLTFDGHNDRQALTDRGTESLMVTFDSALPPVDFPTCAGWDFLGYYLGDELYYHADGTPAVSAWVHAENKTLTAHWRIRIGEWIDKLDLDFAAYGNGENVKKLLLAAEEKAKALDLMAAYLEQLDAIYHEVEQNIGFEKKRDDAIADLRAYYASLVATQAYSANGTAALQQLLNETVDAISSADTISEVDINRLFGEAYLGMDDVRITHLWSVNETCEIRMDSESGLPKGTTLLANQADVSPIRSQLRAATKRGTVLVQAGSMEIRDVRRILSSMDAVAFYSMSLSAQPEAGDTLEFRLLIPENLRSETGFLVAYYENGTETLTVLSTRREGNELLFSAPSAGNAVVFVDHVTDTKPILAVLICILLLQIAVIAALLVGKRRARANAVALPLFAALALRVSPSGSLPAVVILLILVVAAQAVLTYLLLSVLGVRFQRREKEVSHVEAKSENAKAAFAPLPEETPDWVDETPTLTALPENEAPNRDLDWADAPIADEPRQSESEDAAKDIPASTVRLFDDSIWESESKDPADPSKAVKDNAKTQDGKGKADAGNSFSEQAKEMFGEKLPVKPSITFTFDDDK